jgi:glycosyltransferase involved in cell wall biosynthesis
LRAPNERRLAAPLKIYWFGQTLGAFSCAEDVISALPSVPYPIRFSLRGLAVPEYVAKLSRMAESLGVRNRLEFLPIASPQEMVESAGNYDVGWAAQPSEQLFHQLAIGNKVFTGMMAGLALIVTDTIAHRQLLNDARGCGRLIRGGDKEGLSNVLKSLAGDRDMLRKMQMQSWKLAESRFNWEKESRPLLETVRRVLEMTALKAWRC